VEIARGCYDDEIRRRAVRSPVTGPVVEPVALEADHGPDWVDEGAEVYSVYSRPGITGAPEADHVREVLEAAGIPCVLEACEEPEDDPDGRLVCR